MLMTTTPASLKRDPFYQSLWDKCFDLQRLVAAGFVDNPSLSAQPFPLPAGVRWPSLPFDKMMVRLEAMPSDARPVVLLTTGSFAPLHSGHMEMMERAFVRASEAGFYVLGGLVSPSHDVYVDTKQDGLAQMPIGERLEVVQRHVENHPWMACEMWEAVGVKEALNFTDVIARTEEICRRLVHPEVEVIYVFGSDNAAFFDAFCEQGLAMCVSRPGVPAFEPIVWDEARMFCAKGASGSSSTSLRAQRGLSLEEKCEDGRIDHVVREGDVKTGHYVVRNDWAQICRSFGVNHEDLPFDPMEKVMSLLRDGVSGSNLTWGAVDVSEQLNWAEMQLGEKSKRPMVSLDVYARPSPHQLDVSRRFSLGEGQGRALGLVSRPERQTEIEEQVASLPYGSLDILEDDVVSGQTMAFLEQVFGEERKIEKVWCLSDASPRERDVFDVVDLRDFVFGARFGGLVVSDNTGETVRVPYMAPFVNLVSRANVKASKGLSLSADLWALNAELMFVLHHAGAALSQPDITERVMALSGHKLDKNVPFLSMYQYCLFMEEQLRLGL